MEDNTELAMIVLWVFKIVMILFLLSVPGYFIIKMFN